MATYRFYCLDAYDRITSVETADLPDDAEAIKWGTETANLSCAAAEVWQLARKVCRLHRAG
jgi:hypothetical protein